MTELKLRENVVNTAISWLNKNEADGSFKSIIDLYNSIKPLPRGYKMSYNEPWCAAFVSAIALVTGTSSIIPAECSCGEMIKLVKNHPLSKWEENDKYVPNTGDIIFYDWDDVNAETDNLGAPEHVGIVIGIDIFTKIVTVIEGNYDNRVKKRDIPVNGRYIRGYELPNYASLIKPIISVTEAKLIVKQKTGFSDETIRYIADFYRYGTDAILKLANLLKGD